MADNPSQAMLAPAPERVGLPKIWRTIRRWPLLPLAMLLLVVFAGVMAPWIAPEDPRKGNLRARMVPPVWLEGGSMEHVLGTDHLGRDILSRIIHGARISLVVAAVTLGLGGTTGTVLGLLAGWYGKWIDEIIMRVVDIALAVPLVLVALVMVVAVGQAFPSELGGQTGLIILVLASFFWVRFARLVRGEVLQLKTLDYVALAKVAGASIPRILFVHILPGVINTLIVLATLQVGFVILVESTLSFLGAGVPPPTPAWGSMVAEGRDFLAGAWWISTMPGLAILLTVMSLNLFGDWLRDTLDPRLRQLATN
ncbi:MAG: ABC transporter permease [Chloroflexota bacterium]|nr:ABC transporter permease [Chloroflexota bacterium]